jgi:hypothetical protein
MLASRTETRRGARAEDDDPSIRNSLIFAGTPTRVAAFQAVDVRSVRPAADVRNVAAPPVAFGKSVAIRDFAAKRDPPTWPLESFMSAGAPAGTRTWRPRS